MCMYFQMILYLRLCLVHGGGISCDTESLASMQDTSPQVALFVRQLLQTDASDNAPVILYLNFIQRLLSAVGGEYIGSLEKLASSGHFIVLF